MTKDQKIAQLEEKLKIMTKCAQESQSWNWLTAQEHAAELGHDCYEIQFMQDLHEIAFESDIGDWND